MNLKKTKKQRKRSHRRYISTIRISPRARVCVSVLLFLLKSIMVSKAKIDRSHTAYSRHHFQNSNQCKKLISLSLGASTQMYILFLHIYEHIKWGATCTYISCWFHKVDDLCVAKRQKSGLNKMIIFAPRPYVHKHISMPET